MNEEQQLLARPIGWWLKEADARLNAAFDRILEGSGVDRRGWQVLTSLGNGPGRRADLIASLSPFDSPEVVDAVLEALMARGWIEDDGEMLRLTSSGTQKQASVAPMVGEVRRRIQQALPEEDYIVLIRLLARLTEAL